MAIFDIFKKSKKMDLNLDLETILQKAASEPAYRPEFYKRLLSDQLVVITMNTVADGHQDLSKGDSVSIFTYEDGRIPVFTHEQRIFDKEVIKEQVQFMKMKGEELFTMTKGAGFILNPYSDYGKELLAEEIESMLNGTILNSNKNEITIDKPTNVLIGQPAVYPTAIVEQLSKLFAERPNVKAAYLGWISNPESGQAPHYVFALDTDVHDQAVTDEAGFIAQQLLAPGDLVDFMKITNDGFSNYFTKETKAFYKR